MSTDVIDPQGEATDAGRASMPETRLPRWVYVLLAVLAAGFFLGLKGLLWKPPADVGYTPSEGAFTSGRIRGRVLVEGHGVEGAVVLLNTPRPGGRAQSGARLELVVERMRYTRGAYIARPSDEVVLRNADPVLHTAHLYADDGQSISSEPLPPSLDGQALRLPDPGIYTLRCDNHPEERTVLVVVDHPYAARTDGDGAFSMAGVPAGDVRAIAVLGGRRAEQEAVVPEGGTAELTLDFDGAQGGRMDDAGGRDARSDGPL